MTHPRSRRARLALPLLVASAALLQGCATAPPADPAALQEQVRASETAFAATMAARDLNGFASWIAEDAVFVNGGKPLRGKAAVLAHWERFFKPGPAPFAWKPEIVQVLPSGTLAYSEGPVTAPDGRVIARYFSTWRRDADGWRVVLDNGYDSCDCKAKP